MARQISDERRVAYYVGGGMTAVGMVLFLSVFVTGILNFGNFENFDGQARSSGIRAIGGMVLMILGQFVRRIGARGAAGSGLILDPDRARDELEPYSRMAGGMVKDAWDEADIEFERSSAGPERVVMIKCRACGKLNEEDSKFCQECGERL